MTRCFTCLLVFCLCAGLANSASQTQSAASEHVQDPSTSAAAGAQSSGVGQPADAAKPKKVWTNDDVAGARSPGPAAVRKTKESPKTNSGKADAQYINNTKKQLEKLQADLTATEKQLSDLKDFQSGKPAATSAGYQINKGYNRMPVDQQITNLEGKKKQLQAKIEDLLDEARKKGVEPGQLR